LAFQINTICLFLILNCNWTYAQSSASGIDAIDTVFRNATNSPGYVVASKADIQLLKNTLKMERDSLYSQLENQKKELSQLKSEKETVTQPTPVEESPKPVSSSSSPNYLLFQLIIALLVGAVIFYCMKDFSTKKEVKEAKDSYKNLIVEFEDHKKKAIERERKLMRKVIDLQNDLEEKSSPTA
jgi:hypothetical protein